MRALSHIQANNARRLFILLLPSPATPTKTVNPGKRKDRSKWKTTRNLRKR